MIKLAYFSLFIGFIFKILEQIKNFPEMYSLKKENHSSFSSFSLCVIYGIVDVMVTTGCGLFGIELFLIN
ncbi:hypothetical protein [Clostridium sp.]|uniref:hypothetical protein n=1 Tax=Clostridium sp. TaxID=1506 RepID=UPI002FC5993D